MSVHPSAVFKGVSGDKQTGETHNLFQLFVCPLAVNSSLVSVKVRCAF